MPKNYENGFTKCLVNKEQSNNIFCDSAGVRNVEIEQRCIYYYLFIRIYSREVGDRQCGNENENHLS